MNRWKAVYRRDDTPAPVSAGAEAATVLKWRYAGVSEKRPTHPLVVPEAALSGDRFDGQIALLQKPFGGLDAHGFDGSLRNIPPIAPPANRH